MGTYCDRCYTMCGSIGEHNSLEKFDDWDVCSKCRGELSILTQRDINKHIKYNNIGGL